jgi:GNAT superfamily N-acetyltransferase
MYSKKLTPKGFILQNSLTTHLEGLAKLQEIVFPSLSADERMQEKHYAKHLEIFPEGQFVILDGQKIIGMTTTIRHNWVEEDHTFLAISDHLFMTTHQKNGEWLYGMDMGIHLDYRGLGLARHLYRARQELCQTLGLKGQITVGLPYGYQNYAAEMSLDTYFDELLRGGIIDPTVSLQQKMGFELLRLLPNYVNDPTCYHCGILMFLPAHKIV